MSVADLPQTPEQRAAQEKARVLQHPASAAAAPSPLPTEIDWEALEERGEPPPRDWAVEGWLGMGHATMLFGRGGIGKSLFVQQLGTALALGRDFIAPIKQPRRTLLWASEDDVDELWRRQYAICQRFGIALSALRGKFHVLSLTKVQCSLVELIHGELIQTSTLPALAEQVMRLEAEVIILDNVARLFGGDENNRHHASQFIAMLNAAAEKTNGAVLILGHTAKPKDSEYSGSTAWENSARGRLWLTDKPPDKAENGEDEPPAQTDLRYLAKRKVNYSSTDLAILRYERGSYDLVTPTKTALHGLPATIDRRNAQRVVLAAFSRLKAMGLDPVEATGSPNYLPKLIMEHSFGEGFTRHDVGRAMRELMNDGKMMRGQIGFYSNRLPRFGLVLAETPVNDA